MKFYVLRLVDWLPKAVRQTNQSLFQLRIPNFSCGPKNKNPKGLNRGIGDAIVLEPVSH
jgi:hypothetical protein